MTRSRISPHAPPAWPSQTGAVIVVPLTAEQVSRLRAIDPDDTLQNLILAAVDVVTEAGDCGGFDDPIPYRLADAAKPEGTSAAARMAGGKKGGSLR